MEIEKIITAWHAAVNAADEPALAAIVSADVELSGPRGTTHGRDEVLAWIQRAGITLVPTDWHPIGLREMVVAESAMWPGSSEVTPVFTRYRIAGGKIAAIHRFDTLHAALAYR